MLPLTGERVGVRGNVIVNCIKRLSPNDAERKSSAVLPNLTVRVGCHVAYETSAPTPVLFVLKPRREGNNLVCEEKLSFGIGLPSYEFEDFQGNITCRAMLMPGRNDIWHDALVAVSALPDD